MNDWLLKLASWGEVREREPMARHTTLGVGGEAKWYFRPRDRAAAAKAVRAIPATVPLLPLGRGSNLLIPDTGFAGIVVDLGALTGITREGATVTAEAGVRMSRLAARCAQWALTGLEFMATVPGDVGGGVVMNAGAYGQQVSDCLLEVELIARGAAAPEVRPAAALELAYRRSRLPPQSLVLSARFTLKPGQRREIRDRMQEMRERRMQTQPLEMPNCGSVFKNPPGDHAARLIEAAGLKGLRVGGARISNKHANFIVNEGGAKSRDVQVLIRRAQEEVARRFGVHLDPEVRLTGERG